MGLNGGEIISYLSLDTSKYSSAMQAALSDMGVFADRSNAAAQRMNALGTALTTVGTRMTLGLTMPIAGAGVAVGKAAINYESAFAGVRKTVNATEQEFAALSDTILRMSTDTPVAATELASIMESAGQLGVKTQDLEKFTKVMADLSVATNLTSEEAASMLAQYANVTGMDLSNIDRLGSVIVALGNNTATTERDITEMAQRLSGMASTVGLSDAEVMGLAATMASLGISAEAGGTAMSRVMQKAQQAIAAGGEALESWADAAQASAEEFSAAWKKSPIQALNLLLNGLRNVKNAGGDVYAVLADLGLSDARITDTMLRLLGAEGDLTENIQLANDAWSQNTALTTEAEQRYATTESQLQLTKNSIQRLAVSLGNSLLPYVRRGAEFVANLADRFAQLDDSTKNTILTIAALVAAIGPATTLIGGLITLMSGPAGIVVAAGLAAGAIYAMIEASNRENEAKVLKDLEERFGNIELSAEQIQNILSSNLGSVTLDTSALETEKTAMQDAEDKVTELSGRLATEIMLAHLRANTADIDGLPEKAQTLINETKELLKKEENAGVLTISTQFGENSDVGNSIIGDLSLYFAGLNEEFAAKGKELRKALDDAIADGVIDDEEQKTIARLQSELMEIASRGAVIETQTAQDMLLFKAQKRGLSADSIKQFASELGEYRQTELDKAEQLYYDTAKILYTLYNAGELHDEENPNATQEEILAKRMAENEETWGRRPGAIDAESFDLAWKAYGQDLVDAYSREIQEYQELINSQTQSYNPLELYDYLFNKDRDNDYVAAQSAKTMLNETQWLIDGLTAMQQTMGEQMPQEYQDMLTQLQQMQQWVSAMDRWKKLGDHNGGGYFSTTDDEGAAEWWLQNAKYTPSPAIIPVEVTPEYQITTPEQQRTKNKKIIGEAAEDALQTYGPVETSVPVEVTPEYQAADDGKEAISAEDIGIPGKPVNATVSVNVTPDASSQRKAREAGEQLADEAADGADSHQGKFADAGTNAANAFADALSAGKRAALAGSGLGLAAVNAIKSVLQIKSPSRVMQGLGENTAAGYAGGLLAGIPAVAGAIKGMTDAVLNGAFKAEQQGNSFASGYIDGVLNGAKGQKTNPPGNPEQPAESPKAQDPAPSASGKTAAAAATQPLLDNAEEHAAALQRMMDLVGKSSVWYQDSLLDQALEELQRKYDKLLSEANSSNEAYKNQLQESLKKETEAIKKEYQTQQQIALDFLDVREQALRQQLSEKREAARAEDYEKELADLQRRLRQTKSAREKRELQEEIDAMIRDEELRQEESRIAEVSSGFSVLRKALKQGVIGLGDLLADPSLGEMSIGYGGLASIPDISAEQLEAALAAMGEGFTNGGNTYQIDLTGAVIREDDDIQRIVDAFEDRMREIQRGL